MNHDYDIFGRIIIVIYHLLPIIEVAVVTIVGHEAGHVVEQKVRVGRDKGSMQAAPWGCHSFVDWTRYLFNTKPRN